MPADIILRGGKIITMDPSLPEASALAVKNGRILAVGREDEVIRLKGRNTQMIDLQNQLALPGFIDCHVHLTATGLDMMRLDLSLCKNIAGFKKILVDKLKGIKPGQWVLGTGYNELDLEEKRLPAMKELDVLAPENPVWLSRVCGHSSLVNSKAMGLLNITANMQGAEAGETGELTGILRADANSRARQIINGAIDYETRKEALYLACNKMLAVGLTTVHALEGGSLFSEEDVDLLVEEIDQLPLHVKLFHQTTDVSMVVKRGLKQIGGCLLIDGSIGARTAALLEPYADAAGERGTLYFDDKKLQDFVLEAHSRGLQITVHAIGDAAIEQILTAYEKALVKMPRADHRHRIEHYSIPTPTQIQRCVKAGVIMSIQPSWALPGPLVEKTGPARLGPDRLQRLYPVATLLKAGGRICGGSDSPIASVGPLKGIDGAVNHFLKKERISRADAVSMFTKDAAWAVFEEKERGQLSPGYMADIVILDQDIMTVPAENLAGITVNMTIAGGRIGYRSKK